MTPCLSIMVLYVDDGVVRLGEMGYTKPWNRRLYTEQRTRDRLGDKDAAELEIRLPNESTGRCVRRHGL